MASDFWIVLQWWGSLFLVGALAWPLTKALFGDGRATPKSSNPADEGWPASNASRSDAGWWDGGYLFSKAVGMAVVTWVVYVLGTLRVMPFSVWSIGVALGVVFVLGIALQVIRDKQKVISKTKLFHFSLPLIEEIFFLAALLFWSWIKGHEPSIRGLEKFMDFGFMQSILNSRFFPPADMWYAGQPINYYYFGHMVTAVLTKLSGLDLAYTFNLMLATLFALTLTMSFSIGMQLYRMNPMGQMRRMGDIAAGLLTAFLVTLAGNLQTIYAFTKGYTGENVRPFWELWWKIGDFGGIGRFWGKIGEGMNTYWYANATRFIPYTIHEFPGYSFVVSDVHGHVLSIPFVLLAIAMLINMAIRDKQEARSKTEPLSYFSPISYHLSLIFYGFLVGVLLMTNALDGPIYLGLLVVVLGVQSAKCKVQSVKTVGIQLVIVIGAAILTSLPFLVYFKSFVTGLAVNCPLGFLANTKYGPLIFEGVEKCQVSPFWMWWLLWGFFIYSGGGLLIKNLQIYKPALPAGRSTNLQINLPILPKIKILKSNSSQTEQLLLLFFLFSLALVIFPEFLYFKDIYPMHFRSNTMFKLGYQAFILFSIVAGYTIVKTAIGDKREVISRRKRFLSRRLFFIFLLPQLLLVSIFPIFAVRSYFGALKKYEGIYGLNWLAREYPDDWRAIEWLKKAISEKREARSENQSKNASFLSPITYRLSPVLVEADGDSYTDYARFSAFTGIPTIVGWPVHEWLWRGTYDVVAPRREEVRQIYESEDREVTRMILVKYGVRYIVVGKLEREKYKRLTEGKFSELGREVFRSGGTVIYRIL